MLYKGKVVDPCVHTRWLAFQLIGLATVISIQFRPQLHHDHGMYLVEELVSQRGYQTRFGLVNLYVTNSETMIGAQARFLTSFYNGSGL